MYDFHLNACKIKFIIIIVVVIQWHLTNQNSFVLMHFYYVNTCFRSKRLKTTKSTTQIIQKIDEDADFHDNPTFTLAENR